MEATWYSLTSLVTKCSVKPRNSPKNTRIFSFASPHTALTSPNCPLRCRTTSLSVASCTEGGLLMSHEALVFHIIHGSFLIYFAIYSIIKFLYLFCILRLLLQYLDKKSFFQSPQFEAHIQAHDDIIHLF